MIKYVNNWILDGLGCVMGLMHMETTDESGKNPDLVINSTVTVSGPFMVHPIHSGRAARGDVTDPEWSSHSHHV